MDYHLIFGLNAMPTKYSFVITPLNRDQYLLLSFFTISPQQRLRISIYNFILINTYTGY